MKQSTQQNSNNKKHNKIVIILIFVVCIVLIMVILGIVLRNNVIIPASNYKNATILLNNEKYIQAYDEFVALGEYKDSSEKANKIVEKHSITSSSNVLVGDLIFLGEYNGKKLNWTVADVRKDYAILICNSIVDMRPYNNESGGMMSNEPSYHLNEWPKCTLRTWINQGFFTSAFSDEEKSIIKKASVPSAGKDKDEGTVSDFVYIPSEREIEVAIKNGWDADEILIDESFWCRGSSGTNGISANKNKLGYRDDSDYIDESHGVIPIIWIKANTPGDSGNSVFDTPTPIENYSSGAFKKCSVCNGTGYVKYYYGDSDLQAYLDGHDPYTVGKCTSCNGSGGY